MNSMNYIGKFISNFRDFYNEINAATLTGAIDVVVVEQPDGSFTCSPFHVRFGKLGVLRSREKIVDIEINGEPMDIHMKLGDSGEAFFVEEVGPNEEGEEETIPPHLACSPIPCQDQFEPWIKDGDKWNIEDSDDCVAKVFVAETINNAQEDEASREKVRKISIAGEFRTIETEEMQGGKESNSETSGRGNEDKLSSNSSSTSLSQMSHTSDKPSGGGGKKKRRRRSILKKKQQQQQQAAAAAKPEEEVFAMEDVTSQDAAAPLEDSIEPELSALVSSNSLEQITAVPNPETDYHFFSDTELTPGCSPESRSFSPVVSDSELEQRQRNVPSDNPPVATQSWKWGELPSPPTMPQPEEPEHSRGGEDQQPAKTEKQKQEEAQKSMLSGMFSFMKKTKHLRHGQSSEGIYLSELNASEMDPEVMDLYFSHSYRGEAKTEQRDGHREDDAESGNGPSIPHSPNCHSPTTVDPTRNMDMALSLCGHLNDPHLTEELFNQYLVSYDDFVNNPMMIENPNLVVRLGGKYCSWTTACPLVMCMTAFSKPLPNPVVDLLSNELLNKSEASQPTTDKKPTEAGRGYSSWFKWSRSSEPKGQSLDEPAIVTTTEKQETETDKTDVENALDAHAETAAEAEAEEGYAGSNSSEESDGGVTKGAKKPFERRFYQQPLSDKYRKTLRLSSDLLASLNLQDGANEVVFSVTTAYQGTTRCKCHIYKWRHDDRIVISDIDGTITKSDVLGHILPIVGKDWAQSGVAQLFTKIKENGYKLLYLSARAIGQARVTRDYLRSIKQGDLSLPDGPLLLNPTSLISAFHREVIEKKPEEFKISCLRDIAALFPQDVSPFYAGYGNRVNDVFAYRAVGIPIVRIFTINYKGELKHELTQTFQSSYTKMCQLVDEMFPPPAEDLPEGFSSFIFWKEPIQELILDEEPIEADAKNKKN